MLFNPIFIMIWKFTYQFSEREKHYQHIFGITFSFGRPLISTNFAVVTQIQYIGQSLSSVLRPVQMRPFPVSVSFKARMVLLKSMLQSASLDTFCVFYIRFFDVLEKLQKKQKKK